MSTTLCENQTIVHQPAFTTREDDTGVHLQIALPSVTKENIKLTIKEAVLHIEAKRVTETPEDWKNHTPAPKEISYQLQARLSPRFDGTQVRASLENGVLTLDVPIREEAKAREILVN